MQTLEHTFIWRMKTALTMTFGKSVTVLTPDLIEALAYIEELENKIAELDNPVE